MRIQQKKDIQELLSRINRYGDKYVVSTSSAGSRLSVHCYKVGLRDVSPILKPTAFIDWLDAYEEGLSANYERFGVPLVEVTNGVRNVETMETMAEADENVISKVAVAVGRARANYFQNYA